MSPPGVTHQGIKVVNAHNATGVFRVDRRLQLLEGEKGHPEFELSLEREKDGVLQKPEVGEDVSGPGNQKWR